MYFALLILRRRVALLAFVALLAASGCGAWWYAGASASSQVAAASYQTAAEQSDVYVRFEMEAYDSIAKNFWVKPGQYAQFGVPELPELFHLAVKQQLGADIPLATSTRDATAAMLDTAFASATSTDAKRQDALAIISLILSSLPPQGRSALYSQQRVTQLRQEVSNINPEKDLYGDLGLQKGADTAAVQAAYEQRSAALAASSSPEAKQELAQAQYAHTVLADSANKAQYDSSGVEPTIFSHVLGSTLYIDMDRVSPTSLQELARAVVAASTTPVDTMILDLRGNIGGDLDFAQAFLGLFVGPQQYAFDLYHQGDREVQRTTTPRVSELSRFREIAILTDDSTQSTAELTAASMRRFNLAHIVGTRTRGWGSVENTYPLTTQIDPDTAYALFLVNSLTLGDTGEPIEQNGVTPDVDTSKAGWQGELGSYFYSPSLIKALKQVATEPPLK